MPSTPPSDSEPTPEPAPEVAESQRDGADAVPTTESPTTIPPTAVPPTTAPPTNEQATTAPATTEPPSRNRKIRALGIELLKFGSVGGLSYIIDVGLYNIIVFGGFGIGPYLADNPVTAKIITAGIATLFSWVANRLWTFRSSRTDTPVRELIMFIVVNLGAMAIAAGALYFSRWVLDLHTQAADNISGNVIGTGLGTIFRYLCYRFIVFNPRALTKAGRAKQADAS